MSQQYPPQQSYQQQPYYPAPGWPPQPPAGPPKKDNSTRNALVIVAAVMLPIAVIALAAGLSNSPEPAAVADPAVAATSTAPPAASAGTPEAQPTSAPPSTAKPVAPSSRTTVSPKAVASPKIVASPKPSASTRPGSGQEQGADAVCEEDRNSPCTVRVGQAFTKGKHRMLAGWRLLNGPLDTFDVVGKVRNIGDEPSTAFITIKALRGDEVVGDITCNSGSLEPGQIAKLNCFSGDDYTRKFDRVTAEALF